MIDAVVVCPQPPLLLRELSGAQDAVPELRRACLDAIRRSLGDAVASVVVVGGADTTGSWAADRTVDVRRFGTTDAPEGDGLPLSLGVGRRLLDEAGWRGPVHLLSVSWGASDDVVRGVAEAVRAHAGSEEAGAGHTLLLVLADGSARRGAKAPGYLDERAFAFDDLVVDALAAGDAAALRDLDAGLADELMVLGRAAYAVLGSVLDGVAVRDCDVLYRDDPYGVQYTVARWDLRIRP